MPITRFAIVFIISYLLGSINFAIIISKLAYGQDIRKFGSGNAGMTNILRTYGKTAAVFTFIGDALKGAVSVTVAKYLFGYTTLEYLPIPTNSFSIGNIEIQYTLNAKFYLEVAVYIAVLGALLGHLFPLYFSFKGGKGVSVIAGAMLAATPVATSAALAVFGIVVLIGRMVSLASITAAVSYFFFTLMYFKITGVFSLPNLVAAIVFPTIIVIAHRKNIKRLLNGTEYKFGKKKK